MFLDEPTSGLDSGAAFNIVRFLRKLADAGQAILCTIHQPSSVLFENFDTLLLLKAGGRTVYFGELGHDSRMLLDYLEHNGAKRCPPKANPAEYMLDVIGAGNPDYKGQDWGDVWDASPEKEAVSQEIQQLISSRSRSSTAREGSDDREYAMPLSSQVWTVVYRSFTAYWRNPEYVIGQFMLHIFTGLFNTFTFWHLGNSQIDMQSRLFSVFMTLTISPPLMQQLQPLYLDARNIFSSREQNSKIYSWLAFTTGAVVSELPYRVVAGTIYWCCWYWATWFPRDTYTSVSIWAFVIVFEFFYVGFAQAIASFAPNELLASLLIPIFFLFVVSFCGVGTYSVLYIVLSNFADRFRSRSIRRFANVLAQLDVLAQPVQVSARGYARPHHAQCARALRPERACYLPPAAGSELSAICGSVYSASRWIRRDTAEWAVRNLPVFQWR